VEELHVIVDAAKTRPGREVIARFRYIAWVKCPYRVEGKENVNAPRREAGARLNPHTELRVKLLRLARESIHRTRPTIENKHSIDVP